MQKADRLKMDKKEIEQLQNLIVLSFVNKEKLEEERQNNPDFRNDRKMVSSVFNRIFGCLAFIWQRGHNYVHCEISFMTKDQKCLTYAVFSDRGEDAVVKLYRSFNRMYDHIFITVNENTKRKIYRFLDKQVGMGYDFKSAMCSTFWAPKFVYNRRTWNCCALVTSSLQAAGYLKLVRPDCIEIDELYYLMKKYEEKALHQVPFEKNISDKELALFLNFTFENKFV